MTRSKARQMPGGIHKALSFLLFLPSSFPWVAPFLPPSPKRGKKKCCVPSQCRRKEATINFAPGHFGSGEDRMPKRDFLPRKYCSFGNACFLLPHHFNRKTREGRGGGGDLILSSCPTFLSRAASSFLLRTSFEQGTGKVFYSYCS